jgi:hypothetical protein
MLFVAVAIFRCSLGLVSIGVPGFFMGKRDGEATAVIEVRVGSG